MKKLFTIALVMTLSLSGCGGDESQAEKDLDKINKQNAELENKIQNLKSENDQLEKNIQQKEEELQELQDAERSGEKSDDGDSKEKK